MFCKCGLACQTLLPWHVEPSGFGTPRKIQVYHARYIYLPTCGFCASVLRVIRVIRGPSEIKVHPHTPFQGSSIVSYRSKRLFDGILQRPGRPHLVAVRQILSYLVRGLSSSTKSLHLQGSIPQFRVTPANGTLQAAPRKSSPLPNRTGHPPSLAGTTSSLSRGISLRSRRA